MNLTENRFKLGRNIASELDYAKYSNAIFDLDSTLLNSNIGNLLFYINKQEKTKFGYYLWVLIISPLVPFLKIIDKVYRPLAQLIVYSMYAKFDHQDIEKYANEYVDRNLDNLLIPVTNEFKDNLKINGISIHIVSTNLHSFVTAVSEKLSVNGVGISLGKLRRLSFSEKLKYLQNYKSNKMKEFGAFQTIGVGDSIYDKPIFENTNYSIVVKSKNKKIKFANLINNYIEK